MGKKLMGKFKYTMILVIFTIVNIIPLYPNAVFAKEKEDDSENDIITLDDGDSNPTKSWVYSSDSGASYAGSMYFKYNYGVAEYVGYINVSTADVSDIVINGGATDSWGYRHPMAIGANQTTYASTSVQCPTFNQISIIDYYIRVDGPESGTTVSGSRQFADMDI